MLTFLGVFLAGLPRWNRWLGALAALIGAGAACGQTVVALRPSASLESAAAVTLDRVAEVTGPEAESLRSVIVRERVETGGSWVTIDLAEVRAALDARGVNWGKVTLRGSRCTLRLPTAPLQVARDVPAATVLAPGPVDVSGPATVRTLIAERLATHYGVEVSDLRLGLDARHEGLLSTLIEGRRVHVDPIASTTSARMAVSVTVYSGEAIAVNEQVQVAVQINRDVVTPTAEIDRGRTVSAEQVRVERQWVAPGGLAPATLSQVVGAVAQTRLVPGRVIAAQDLETPLACKRGDTVEVHCLAGSVLVKTRARAAASARDGELVQLKLEGSDTPFLARMSGRGRAVMIVDDAGAAAAAASLETNR